LKSKKYYLERAAYMRQMAKEAQTEALRASCLRAAEAYEILAQNAGKLPDPDAGQE
jgi:type VI protein secretion system component VasF